jgi:hypothetical protein
MAPSLFPSALTVTARIIEVRNGGALNELKEGAGVRVVPREKD